MGKRVDNPSSVRRVPEKTMMAFIVLLLAALSRFVPHMLHGIGLNFTAVGGGLLFFGARRPRWQVPFAVSVMALTDLALTRFVYGFPFHPTAYFVTWAWYAGACLLGGAMLRRATGARVALAVICSATGFFLLSNLMVWAGGGLYPHTAAGLAVCYLAAIPFYANDLVSTGLTSAMLFGLPVVAAQITTALARANDHSQPLH